MNYEELKAYLLAKPFATLDFPFGGDVSVFKVNNKMFALVGTRNNVMMINLKCDPDEAAALCDIYSAITPGYHMDKKHWISLYFDGSVADSETMRLIDNSFNLVVSKLSKKEQLSIKLLNHVT